MKKWIKRILLVLLLAFIVMQFIRPDRNISDVVLDSDLVKVTNTPDEIQTILKTSCYDCHSNNTAYPWYSNIAPVSYWLDDHIEHGKGHLDFSQWSTYSAKKKAHKLEELIEEVKEHKMPLDSYLWIHKDAKLSEDQITQLTNWAQNLRTIYQSEVK